ncbi:hypothetical protein J437_LFUL001164 [Ladona fulva]|uniref:F-box domain-containing protein n=1 Tax=Ladona fulva TaxID=123851 RepID=A0A8K0JWT4_LADFU|nr:hypothetical protein J437_LFUL001164 [Ladona fulva]
MNDMQAASWIVDDNNEESYIDMERDVEDDDGDSWWSMLPDLILEKIYSYLTLRERYYASMVCRRWSDAFYLPYVWSRFVFQESTLTRRKFNYYMGWQHVLDHLRTQICFSRVGRHIHTLIFEPMYNFHNLYEFMTMASYFVENHGTSRGTGFGERIEALSFTFPCEMGDGTGNRWGTGPGAQEVTMLRSQSVSDDASKEDNVEITPKERAAQRRAFRLAAFEARQQTPRARARAGGGPEVFGTGGKLLEALKRLLLDVAHSLNTLELVDLMLEEKEAQVLLDDTCASATLSMRRLTLVNITRHHSQLLHPGVFVNLQASFQKLFYFIAFSNVLTISPQNIGPDVILLLGKTSLHHLHLLQNHYFASGSAQPVPYRVWRRCREDNPRLEVHLELKEGVHKWRRRVARRGDSLGESGPELVWQDGAPVKSIVYESPYAKVSSMSVMTAVELYGNDLEVFGHRGLPHFWRSRSFHDRADSLLLLICRRCTRLHTLVIRERVSTATVILLAKTAPNLKRLLVRRNAVLLRCDWPKSAMQDDDNYLLSLATSYESTEKAVSTILGQKWSFMSDRQFKNVCIELHRKTR